MRPLFFLLVLGLALGTAACGKRGDLRMPDGETQEYPRQYPPPPPPRPAP
jgi:predicted small lipoprotein YifL